MKDWFPFTSYDFYAYLTAGMVALAAVDRVFFNSMLAGETNWTVANGAFWAAIAYLLGQIIAIPSSSLLEHVIARQLFHPPSDILLGLRPPRRRELFVRWLFGASEYAPFPAAIQTRILDKIGAALHVPTTSLDGETAFHSAFPQARDVSDTAKRLDEFRDKYGMSRNVSFAALVAFGLMTWRACHSGLHLDWVLSISALILALGMFGRFLKFYAAFAREIFRTYNKVATTP
jgi:hypothetical protein